MTKISVIYHSNRGHTAKIAKAVHEGTQINESVESLLISIEEVQNNWDFINDSSAIIFGSPTFMGTISAPFKTFMDSTSKIWFKRGWKDKIAAGFVNSGWPSGDKLNTMMQLVIFAAQHGMIWVNPDLVPGDLQNDPEKKELNRLGCFLGVMSQASFNESAEAAPPECDCETARILGKRVAEIAVTFDKGKSNSSL